MNHPRACISDSFEVDASLNSVLYAKLPFIDFLKDEAK